MKYKLVASDLDGTLLNDDSVFTEKNSEAIKKITELGVHFAIVTGRTYYEIPEALRDCKEIEYVIYSDGAVAMNKNTGEILFSKYFSATEVGEIFDLLDCYDTMIELYENGYPVTDKSKINDKSYEYYEIDENYRDVITQTRVGVSDFKEYAHKSEKTEIFNVFFKNQSERADCMKKLRDFDDISFTTSMTNNIEIMPKVVSKGKALSRLSDVLSIPWNKIIAAGDSSNDVTMFAFSGLSLAPSNAGEEIINISGHKICSNNDGIADYIYKYILK